MDKLEAIFVMQKELMERLQVPVNLLEQLNCIRKELNEYGTRDEAELKSSLYGLMNKHSVDLRNELERWHKEIALAIIMEATELMDWAPWKHWSSQSGNKLVSGTEMFSEGHCKEIIMEVVDLLHFVIEFAAIYGVTADQLYDQYVAKMKVNHQRQDSGRY